MIACACLFSSFESKESDSIAFFGISPGQVLCYAPLLAMLAGLLVNAEMSSLVFGPIGAGLLG